jgi:hypothetical protein
LKFRWFIFVFLWVFDQALAGVEADLMVHKVDAGGLKDQDAGTTSSQFLKHEQYTHSSYLTKEMKKEISPYLLPLDHPIKPILDQIFSNLNVIESKQSLIEAGFVIITKQHKSSIFVVKHPLAPEFVFKLYCNSHPKGRENTPGWKCLAQRCKNARKVKKIIEQNGLQYFTVPNKWLYVISPSHKKIPQNHQFIILVATDMKLVSPKATKLAWKKRVTHRHLDELHLILSQGYGSSYLLNNIPFTEEETFTLIDLEKPKRNIHLKRIRKYFSDDMKTYWDSLVD